MAKYKLTAAQKEIIRFLARGEVIFFDDRGKLRLSTKGKTKAQVGMIDRSESSTGIHQHRPTIEKLWDLHLLTGVFDDNQRAHWVLNKNNSEYASDIKELQIESALGVTRKVIGK